MKNDELGKPVRDFRGNSMMKWVFSLWRSLDHLEWGPLWDSLRYGVTSAPQSPLRSSLIVKTKEALDER